MKYATALALAIFTTSIPAFATDAAIPARVATIMINSHAVTTLHLRPGFESVIHMPEAVTSVVLGDPAIFKAEHSEGEPEYVYVRPLRQAPSQSNLMIATQSGEHVSIELVNDGTASADPVDFLFEYKHERGFLVTDTAEELAPAKPVQPLATARTGMEGVSDGSVGAPPTALDTEYLQQQKVSTPAWVHWKDEQIETSVGDVRQWDNQVEVAFSVLNPSTQPLEIVPPQIQISGLKIKTKKKKNRSVTADQLAIRGYRLSSTRLEPGGRADGVVLFDRPNDKQSSEQLFLQLAEAKQIDRPVLVRLPFTPPSAGTDR